MPTITINLADLLSLSGLALSESEVVAALSALKCETENPASAEGELTIEVTSDRPDLFSCEGIARAVRSYVCACDSFKAPFSERAPIRLMVDPSVSSVRPFIVASAIFGVTLADEGLRQIMQLQEKLHSTYGSKRRKASIGVYDLDKVVPDLIYAAPLPRDISFIPLDETRRMNGTEILELTQKGREYADIMRDLERYPLLSDCKGNVLSMPPILNSESTRVTKDSRNLFIDVTGTDGKTINTCLNVMVTSVLERGGKVGRVEVVYSDRRVETPILEPEFMKLHHSEVSSVSGLALEPGKVASLLKLMGFQSKPLENALDVEIPPYRVDVMHEVDLVEEVIMAYGLNNMQPEYPRVATTGKPMRGSRIESRIRDLMVGMGFQEISTFMLSSKEVEERALCKIVPHVEIIRPMSSEYSVLRSALTPKLLQFLGSNTHCAYPQKIFEYGDVVEVDVGVPITSTRLSAAISDYRVSFEDMQAVAAALFRNLTRDAQFSALSQDPLIEGRAAKIIVGGKDTGFVGEVSPGVLVDFGMESPAVIMEIDMSSLVPLESLFLS